MVYPIEIHGYGKRARKKEDFNEFYIEVREEVFIIDSYGKIYCLKGVTLAGNKQGEIWNNIGKVPGYVPLIEAMNKSKNKRDITDVLRDCCTPVKTKEDLRRLVSRN